MNIDLDFAKYAEAYTAAFAGLRGHTIDLSSGTLVYRWVDTNEVATSADLANESRRVDAEEQAVRDLFQADLEGALASLNTFPATVAAQIYSQVMAFMSLSYECIVGDESEAAYWEIIADRAQELAELITFAAHEIK